MSENVSTNVKCYLKYYFAAMDATSLFVPHNEQHTFPMEDYVKIIYHETKGCDYVCRFLEVSTIL